MHIYMVGLQVCCILSEAWRDGVKRATTDWDAWSVFHTNHSIWMKSFSFSRSLENRMPDLNTSKYGFNLKPQSCWEWFKNYWKLELCKIYISMTNCGNTSCHPITMNETLSTVILQKPVIDHQLYTLCYHDQESRIPSLTDNLFMELWESLMPSYGHEGDTIHTSLW